MSSKRFTFLAAVYLLLERNGRLLLLRRFNTGWMDGKYTLPAGHVDGNETITDCMSRETLEETGIIINPENLKVVHIMHNNDGIREYFDFYLTASKWQGSPEIQEPDKADDLCWFPKNKLPENILQNVKFALSNIQNNVLFSEFTWK
jgi:8-oxo-dGTP diphosphatase